jgi:hypothetical protein
VSELLDRLLGRDATLWPEGNVSSNRLGWLDVVERMRGEAAELTAWAGAVDASKIVLLGMGGSSLGPLVLGASVGSQRLHVLDTTDPATVASVDPADSFFLVSSKSGGTLEVKTLLAHFWERIPDPSRYAAITDPGTSLGDLARERGFARIFENPPDIGGRYSVLSYFGIVPAALCGVDIAELLERALVTDREEAIELGVRMGEAGKAGRDKLSIVVPVAFYSFGAWVEQLIAESTGKSGTGLVPVPAAEAEEGADREVLTTALDDALDLGTEFFRWEIATAIAGHVLGIDPFDEPNVTESKNNTNEVLAHLPLPEVEVAEPAALLPWLRENVGARDYVSVQAYLPMQPLSPDAPLERVRRRIRDVLGGAAVTAGFGPRVLHSTGQLHKGGPNEVVAVQLVPRAATADVPIPGYPYDFATLISAQSIGDLQSLQSHGRRVLRVAVDNLEDLEVELERQV